MIKTDDSRIHTRLSRLLSVFLFLALSPLAHPASAGASDEAYRNALEVFERRIVPIMKSPNSSVQRFG